jgi:hypothetical protein
MRGDDNALSLSCIGVRLRFSNNSTTSPHWLQTTRTCGLWSWPGRRTRCWPFEMGKFGRESRPESKVPEQIWSARTMRLSPRACKICTASFIWSDASPELWSDARRPEVGPAGSSGSLGSLILLKRKFSKACSRAAAVSASPTAFLRVRKASLRVSLSKLARR